MLGRNRDSGRETRLCRRVGWLWFLIGLGGLLLGGCQPSGSPLSVDMTVPATDAALSLPAELPEPLVLVDWGFRTGKALEWKPTHDLRGFNSDEEGLHTFSIGGDPYMVGPVREIDASAGYYVTVRMRSTLGSDAQLFWVTSQDSRYDEAKSQHFAPKPDGRWRTYLVPVHENPTWAGTVTQLRLDPTVQEGSDITIAWIRVVGMQSGYAKIASFGTTTAVVECDRPFTIRARIVNGGDTATEATALLLALPEALSLVEGNAQVALDSLEGGDERVVSWTVLAPAGVYELFLMDGDRTVGKTFAVVADTDSPPQTLDNGALRLVFPQQPYGYGVAALSMKQRPVGRLRSLGALIYRAADGSHHEVLLFAERAEQVEDGLRFPFAFRDVDGVEWQGESLFCPTSDGTGYEVHTVIRADQDVQILNWTGLALYAGDDAFGAVKESALFPGIEFLLDEEQSSGTDFFSPPGHQRYVPDPLKVTVPLMAVTQDGTSLGLTWDPLRSWDGQHDRPGALFASPNTWDGQDNQVMALFVPGPVLGGEENCTVISTPYPLVAGQALSLTARIFAVPAQDALAPLAHWLTTYELPSLPPLPRSYEEGIRLSLDSTVGPTWDEQQRGWHYALHDPWGPGSSPANELHLWLAVLRGELAPDEQAEYRELVRELSLRSDCAGGQPNPGLYLPTLSMHLADTDNLLRIARVGRERLGGQNAEGFWPYVPQTRSGRPFGEAGDTSSGQVAANALFLLRFARIIGDEALREAGLRALDYMEAHQSRRPEGAQAWELPLHCPDLLAAAWAQQCYLEAFWLTGDPDFAERAQWWALSGLPFVYLWSAPDRPVMAYTTVPVFAATNYTYSWLGRPVMWNGLDYAFGLWHLNRALDEAGVEALTDWRQVAEGITRAAMQMQPEEGPFLGMYPDAWDVVAGGEAYSWWLHPFYILQNLFLMEGAGAEVRTVILRDGAEAVHVNTVADILRAERVDGSIELELSYYAGETCVLMINQLPHAPAEVRVDGQPLELIASLVDQSSGWLYRDGTLLIKVPFADAPIHVVVNDI